MNIIRVQEYKKVARESLQEKEWEELLKFIKVLAYFCEKNNIEDKPHKENENEVTLMGFIGNYKFSTGKLLKIQLNQDKLTNFEFSLLIKEIIYWATMIGSPFLKDLLNICSPFKLKNEIVLVYSELLIRCTENALSEYIPPLIEKKRYIAPVPLGKILISPTISRFSRGQLMIVSQRINVNVLNLFRIFLVKFHAIMLQELKNLELSFKDENLHENTDISINPVRTITSNRNYHSNFIMSEINQNVINRVDKIDFTKSDVIQELWVQASTSPSFRDIILLWEGFIGKRALFPKIEDILSGRYMLKPLSKLYELWCLKVVLDVLKELYGEYYEYKDWNFKFRDIKENWTIEVLFNQTPPWGDIIERLKKEGLEYIERKKERPDITITFLKNNNKKITFIIEVKYRPAKNIKLDDIRNFCGYILFHGSKSKNKKLEGILFHPQTLSDEYIKPYKCIRSKNSNIRIHLIRIKPKKDEYAKARLKYLFQRTIRK